jgi:hypothetical protein
LGTAYPAAINNSTARTSRIAEIVWDCGVRHGVDARAHGTRDELDRRELAAGIDGVTLRLSFRSFGDSQFPHQ